MKKEKKKAPPEPFVIQIIPSSYNFNDFFKIQSRDNKGIISIGQLGAGVWRVIACLCALVILADEGFSRMHLLLIYSPRLDRKWIDHFIAIAIESLYETPLPRFWNTQLPFEAKTTRPSSGASPHGVFKGEKPLSPHGVPVGERASGLDIPMKH
ncbi:hypothetical protein HAX54_048916 [Datura stramonium]|uniref:Uncharacterized protein n=1 Tax=Datura stramonium TaxID=4076 RepID=A0ABS8WJX0_DATST|nr:hypothetical protein [Datura stramonium]